MGGETKRSEKRKNVVRMYYIREEFFFKRKEKQYGIWTQNWVCVMA